MRLMGAIVSSICVMVAFATGDYAWFGTALFFVLLLGRCNYYAKGLICEQR